MRKRIQPFRMCTGEGTTWCPYDKGQVVPALNPAGWQEQGWGAAVLGAEAPVRRHHPSCSNLPVPTASLGFRRLQIRSGAALLVLGQGAGLCGKGWRSCAPQMSAGDPGSRPSTGTQADSVGAWAGPCLVPGSLCCPAVLGGCRSILGRDGAADPAGGRQGAAPAWGPIAD